MTTKRKKKMFWVAKYEEEINKPQCTNEIVVVVARMQIQSKHPPGLLQSLLDQKKEGYKLA